MHASGAIIFSRQGEVFGGTMVAPNAGELVAELVLAKSAGLKVDALFNKTYAYPTATRINKRLISSYFADKLNPLTKKLLKLLY